MIRNLAPAVMVALLASGIPTPLKADVAGLRARSHILSLFVLPGETVGFDLARYAGVPPTWLSNYRFRAPPGVGVKRIESEFQLTAPPTVGIYPVVFQGIPVPGQPAPLPYQVKLVVMVPAEQVRGSTLNGYPVGRFPEIKYGARWRFEPPRGFVEITPENKDTLLSDHIRLGQLDCKLEAPYPHYGIIQTVLLVKIEDLSHALRQRGLPGDIQIMSGFRTPGYNRSLGNLTTFSRHIAGDAADIFVDADGDGVMDDLNQDGQINTDDSRFLLGVIDEMDQSLVYGSLSGGASAYGANKEHGPFVHLDVRGYPARW